VAASFALINGAAKRIQSQKRIYDESNQTKTLGRFEIT
jgi:hypothetical protein